MAYKPSPECLDAASRAAGGVLGRDDLHSTFERVSEMRDKLVADGKVDGIEERLRSAVDQEAERTKIAAALQRKQAALNVLVRDRLTTSIAAYRAQGLTPRKAILAILEGTQQGVKEGRVSVASSRIAFEGRYVGDMFSQIAKDRPYLLDVITEKQLNDDVVREMAQLHENGKPGITGNKDAEYLAKTFATYAELSRTDLNKRGASIGKLDGWSGAQVHDDLKMIGAGKDAWVTSVLPKLDIKRTFPDAQSPAEIADLLSNIYDTLITGIDNKAPKEVAGGRVNPASLARSLGKSRVLHFKGADEALAYQNEFGFGNAVSGILAHQRKAARLAAAMDRLGPNPEAMLRSVIERTQKDIRNDASLTDTQRSKFADQTTYDNVSAALDIATGLAQRPVNVTAAKLGSDIRSTVSMAKLGGAVLTAMPTDTATAASASMFRGGGYFSGLFKQIDGIMRGRPKGEQREIAFMYGEGMEGITGHILSMHADAHDAPIGAMSRLAETFFKWNRLTWWDEVSRSVNARMVGAEMGMRAKTAFGELPDKYRHVLELNGIHEPDWRAIQQSKFRAENGNDYVMPDSMRGLPDAAVSHLATADVARANADLLDRVAARKAKTDLEAQWVEKRTMRLAGKMGREEARLEDTIAGMKGKADAQTVVLKTKIGDLKGQLSELADFYSQGKGTERGVARQEMSLQQRVAGAKKAAAKIQKGLAENLAGLDEGLNTRLAGHLDAIGKIEDRLAGSEDVKATAAGSAKVSEIQDRIQKAMDDIEARRGKMEAGAQGRADALHGKLDDLQTKLADVSGSYPIQKGQARAVGRDEGRIAAKEREINRSIADINSGMEKAGKDKGASMLANWAKREGELKEFTDRMGRYAKAREAAGAADVAAHADRLAEIHGNKRFDLEMAVRRFVSDEVRYGILQTDAQSRRMTLGGSRPGTLAGETMRFLMQFKGFPAAFTTRIGGRALFGSAGATKGQRALNGVGHIGALIAGLTIAGYMSKVMKDALAGKTPQIPADAKTARNIALSAFMQGGAAGIYGDYIFAQANRFGNSPLETAAGPTATSVAGIVGMFQKARDGDSKAGQWLNTVVSNTPFAGLFYVRPALDFLFLNSLREAASPGYLKRQERTLQQNTNQRYFVPRTLSQAR